MSKLRNYMVDQFDEPLEVGRCYGGHLCGQQTRAQVFYVDAILRDRWVMRHVDTTQPKTEGVPAFTGQRVVLTNLMAGLYSFIRLDEQYREVTEIAEPAKSKRVANMRRGLEQIAKDAARIRQKQTRLIQEVALALEGAAAPDDVGDMAAAFVRDDESHITIEQMVELYSDSLYRRETES
jgi:hypothetical protein